MKKKLILILILLCSIAGAGAEDHYAGETVEVFFYLGETTKTPVSALLSLEYDHESLELIPGADFENDNTYLYDPAGLSEGTVLFASFHILESARPHTYTVILRTQEALSIREYKARIAAAEYTFDVISRDNTNQIPPSGLEIGDIVTFGHYEADGNLQNGKEPITWYCIGFDGGDYVQLLSRFSLAAKAYDTSGQTHRTWENCTLRKWMNEEFLQDAFTAEEIDQLKEKRLITEHNVLHQKVITRDKVYLLAREQIEKLEISMRIAGSTYVANMLSSPDFWWTREAESVNIHGEFAAWGFDGEVTYLSGYGLGAVGVRPTICVPLSALE